MRDPSSVVDVPSRTDARRPPADVRRAQDALSAYVDGMRVLVTVGAGGVGKTTTAAALALAAAARGRRVLCLTIDPAKRLAQSLGLGAMTTEAVVVDPARFADAGLVCTGSLTAMMLDTKRTFDDIVRRHSSSPEKAERLLQNHLYQYMSTSLAGTQEYMAMEKLVAVQEGGGFDLIVLDTPPTANALDFLDAPDRMIDVLASPSVTWLIDAFQTTGKLSLNLLARSAAVVLRGMARITGGGFLEDMARLLSELNELFGGFRERATRVKAALRDDGVRFLLVTSPAPASVDEARFFAERLREAGIPQGAFVVNRYRGPQDLSGTPEEWVSRVHVALANGEPAEGAPPGETSLAQRAVRAYQEGERQAAWNALHVAPLLSHDNGAVPVVLVPERDEDVHDLTALSEVARSLVGAL